MNYLQLCQRAGIECGVTGTISTVAGQTGSWGRIVGWVADAWSDIPMEHDDWDWMRSSQMTGGGASFQTVAGQASYPVDPLTSDNFGKWDTQTFRIYTTSVGMSSETFLDCIPYDAWRDGYMFGAMRSVQTRPVAIAVGPDQSLNLGPPPSGLYTVTADFFTGVTDMTVDADLPIGLPTRFHMLIVYAAMFKYAYYESAPDVKQRASAEYDPMFRQLEALRLPQIGFSGALA